MSAAAILAASCQEAELGNSNITGSETFRISAPIQQTKTVFNGDNYNVAWENSDQMTVTVNSEGNYTFVKSAEGSDIFETSDNISVSDGDKIFALYPADNDITAITIPSAESATQTGINSTGHIKGVIYGTGTVSGTGIPSIQMHQLTALLKIDVTNSSSAAINVTGITVSANAENQYLSGTFGINQETGAVTAAEATASTSLNVENGTIEVGETGTFWVSANPFTLPQGSELEITVKTDKGSMTDTRTYEKALNFAAGTVNKASFDYNATGSLSGKHYFNEEGSIWKTGRGAPVINEDGSVTFITGDRLIADDMPLGRYTFSIRHTETAYSEIYFVFPNDGPANEIRYHMNAGTKMTDVSTTPWYAKTNVAFDPSSANLATLELTEAADGSLAVKWILNGTEFSSLGSTSNIPGARPDNPFSIYIGMQSGEGTVTYEWYEYTPVE